MRQIKFRAWNKHTRSWADLHGVESMSCWEVFNKRVELLQGNDWVWQQYTGLKDKNGTEIYEGDVVNIWHIHDVDEGHEHIADTLEVVFRESNASFCLRSDKDESDYPIDVAGDVDYFLEVIGNIYENPELLTDETK